MLNAHCHLHCCVIDGLIEPEGEGIGFRPAVVDTETIAQVQREVRARVLRLFARRAVIATATSVFWPPMPRYGQR